MAISPPSDILLDVAGAADPARVQAAKARLAALAADPAASDAGFADALARAKAEVGSKAGSTQAAPAQAPVHLATAQGHGRVNGHAAPSAYTKFEAVLLQSFVESMLPKDSELFGDKESAGVYRSLMAEQFANEIARAGGVGIARALEKAHPDAVHPATAHPAAARPAPAVPTTAS